MTTWWVVPQQESQSGSNCRRHCLWQMPYCKQHSGSLMKSCRLPLRQGHMSQPATLDCLREVCALPICIQSELHPWHSKPIFTCVSCMQEAKAVAAVSSELESFQAEMQQASLSQRQVGQAAVAAAVQRAQRFVDRTLRLSNLSTLSAYVLGQGPLPVSKSFQVCRSCLLL